LLLVIPLFFIVTGIAQAGQITLAPCDQNGINQAIEQSSKNGDTVYLSSGVYEIEGPIKLLSNVKLTGEKDAIVRVSASSSQWFGGRIGIIGSEGTISNVEISGFSLDGNCQNLPSSYANKYGIHDAERGIFINGYTNDYCKNISIHDMKIYDLFSDGIHFNYANNIDCYNNFLSNCQHSSIFYVCVVYGSIFDNEVAGITSDCLRLDDCQEIRVHGNILYSYNGSNNNNAYENGQNLIQIGDESNTEGLKGGTSKTVKTKNIEVYGNVFTNQGLRAILLDNVELAEQANVFIHNNTFLNQSVLETHGIPVNYTGKVTVEKSEQIMHDIFSILDTELTVSGDVTQNELHAINPIWQQSGTTLASIYLAGYQGLIRFGNYSYIPVNASKCVRILTSTDSTREHIINQDSSTELTDGENNTLIVKLSVKTVYQEQKKNPVTIFGKTINLTSYQRKTEHAIFYQTFDAPPVFPTVKAPIVKVTYYNGSHAIVIIPDVPGIAAVDVKIENSSARQYRLIGEVGTAENGFRSTQYNKVDTWKFTGLQLSRSMSGLYIREPFNLSDLQIYITTPYKRMEVTQYDYVKIEDTSNKIVSIPSITLLFVLVTFGRAIVVMLKGKLKCLRD